MNKVIYFDMDGTIANLYGVDNWLAYLKEENTYPYKVADTLFCFNTFAKLLNKLQKQGFTINIISWTAKNGTKEYNERIAEVKKAWLKKHLRSVHFDNIFIVNYGTPKYQLGNGILFDDEEQNRKAWTGLALDEKNILNKLKELTKQ